MFVLSLLLVPLLLVWLMWLLVCSLRVVVVIVDVGGIIVVVPFLLDVYKPSPKQS